MILGEDFEHDHAGPPVVVGSGAEAAVGLLGGEGPVEEFLGFGFEAGVVELPGEGDEAVEEVGASLPGFAGAAEPAAVGANVGPGLVEMPAEAVGLDLELGEEPAGGADGAEGEGVEGVGG